MKIAMMGGAYVNSGDFLIEQRSKKLLETILGADVDILKRDISYDMQIEHLNKYDEIVFAGGPIFQTDIYPTHIPFVSDLKRIEIPIRILGGGWKGQNISPKEMYRNYIYDNDMMRFIQEISEQYAVGCRDWYTVRNLLKSGISNTVMTGCPAWYDMTKICDLSLSKRYEDASIRDSIAIGISDPALVGNIRYFYELIHIIERNYADAKIKVFYHRGISSKDMQIMELLCKKNANISYVDMSGSCDKFAEYDECFMHIGFRVHAHIYNLSQGNVSVLINEDARGVGVNHALGLENINCLLDNTRKYTRKINVREFEMIILDYLRLIEQSNYLQYRRAIFSIRETFKSMETFITHMK